MRPSLSRVSLSGLLFVLLCAVLVGSEYFPSGNSYFPVTTTADSGPGSLRNAIAAAGDGDVVYFVPALNGQTITLTSGEVAINSSITIQGPGPDLLRVNGTGGARAFHVLPGHTVNIQGLTIQGNGHAKGGAILNERSTLNLTSCTVSASGTSDEGGGIYNDGAAGSATLAIIDGVISSNFARWSGGGICNNASNGGSAKVSMWNSRVIENAAWYFGLPFGSGYGGGISNQGSGATLALTNCVVSNNSAGLNDNIPVGDGGGIYNQSGTVTIMVSTIDGNQTYQRGGGIFSSGTLTVINSTVSRNQARGTHDDMTTGYGGGVHCDSGSATLTGSTLSGNFASNSGGAMYGKGTVIYSTISAENFSRGGIFFTGELTIGDTILKTGLGGANISGSSGSVTSLGYNLSNDNGGGFLTGPGDQINIDPKIASLQNNGGPTLTHALLNDSPAIDPGDPGFAPPPYEDQRGVPRVFNGRVDIGSFEVQPLPSPTPTPTPAGTPCGYVITLNENFDGVTAPALPPGWSSSFTSGYADCTPGGTCALGTNWGSNNTDPDSAPHCVFHNAPGCVTDSSLVTPSFVPGPSNQAYLTFQQSFDLESGRDGGVLEISINGGPFVDFADIGGHPGYTGTIASDSASPLAGRAAWTGNSGGYQNRSMTFPLAAQFQNVRVRFRLATDCSGASPGWRIDNIMVVDNLGCQPPTPTPPPPSPTPARALNVSTRLRVETGERVMIGGFIITGSGPKRVVLRGLGPSLANFGLPDVLADPVLELRDASGGLLQTNDNWQNNGTDQGAQLVALGLAPQDPKESGIIATLPSGAAYTTILTGKNGGTGVGLLEVYDTDQGADSQLANISTRGFVQTGNNVMIGGFILGDSSGGTSVAVRGIGPSLSQFGLSNVLADPTLELRDSNGMLLISNDNWQDDSASAAQLTARGLAPQNSLESGIFASLPAGTFTAILAGKNGGTGIGLVEIYNVQ